MQFHTVSQKLRADLSSGHYTVKWRIVSEDGHPVSGRFSFTVSGEKTRGSSAGEASALASPEASSAPAETAPSAAAGSHSTALAIGIIVIAVIVIGFAVAFAVRRRSRSQ